MAGGRSSRGPSSCEGPARPGCCRKVRPEGHAGVLEEAHNLLIAVLEADEQVEGFAPLDPSPVPGGGAASSGLSASPSRTISA
jgi:hypothetical protein